MFVTSGVLAYNYERLFGSTLPFPSVADSFHLAFYPFLVGGLLLLIHEREEDRDRSALIDALTVTLALATLLWVYLISPYANDHSMSDFEAPGLDRLPGDGHPRASASSRAWPPAVTAASPRSTSCFARSASCC